MQYSGTGNLGGRDLPVPISSRHNAWVKQVRSLCRGRGSSASGLFCAEGVRLVEEALAAGAALEFALASPRMDASDRGARLHRRLRDAGAKLLVATDHVLASVSEVAGDQGVAAVVRKPSWQLADLLPAQPPALVVVAVGVQDPGNLGTIIRTADAAGATGLLAGPGTACPFNTKCVRATMGAIFRLRLLEVSEVTLLAESLRRREVQLLGTALSAGARHTDVDLTRPAAIVLGGEGGGLTEAQLAACDCTVRIPLRPQVESLNVASAAAVLLYEAARQRGFEGLA